MTMKVKIDSGQGTLTDTKTGNVMYVVIHGEFQFDESSTQPGEPPGAPGHPAHPIQPPQAQPKK